MAWTYAQRSGEMSHNGEPIEPGYAGNGDGLNNPDAQDQMSVGPLPRGSYTIGAPTDNAHMGPFVLPLTPDPGNTMFGRSGFFIHGDKINGPPHTASDGCIILSRGTRNDIASSGDTALVVVAG